MHLVIWCPLFLISVSVVLTLELFKLQESLLLGWKMPPSLALILPFEAIYKTVLVLSTVRCAGQPLPNTDFETARSQNRLLFSVFFFFPHMLKNKNCCKEKASYRGNSRVVTLGILIQTVRQTEPFPYQLIAEGRCKAAADGLVFVHVTGNSKGHGVRGNA